MSDHSPFRRYLSNILHRKVRKKDKLHEVKYEDSISSSMENLLNVASSIPLSSPVVPPFDDPDDLQSSTEHLFSPLPHDLPSDDQSEAEDQREIEAFAASVLSSDVSSSPTRFRQFSADSGCKRSRVRQPMLSSVGRLGSQMSDKESDFDDDVPGFRGERLSVTSGQTNSAVFNLSEDDSEYYTVGRRAQPYKVF